MTGWTEYVSVTVAVIGLVQALFLCLLLRSEGVRAFGANRWMMLFIAAIAVNLIEDVSEKFVTADMGRFLDLFFGPVNFAIAPAIYLYFREISGNPSRRPWGHFILPMAVFNLTAWVITHDGGRSVFWAGGPMIRELADSFCWIAIFIQISLYIALLWKVTCRYFRQTQEQLGADRVAMQRWLGVILGGLTLVFLTVAIGRIVGAYQSDQTEMFGTEIAFALVLFAMSYEIATRPALFVMADWPVDIDLEDEQDGMGRTNRTDGINDLCGRAASEIPGLPVTAIDTNETTDTAKVRPVLDDEGVACAVAKLRDIQAHGDILLDPLVSLPKLARNVGITPNQLSYVLNRHMGQSFFDFVNRARVQEARSVLLQEPDRTILDIALSVGFNSKSTFNLAFKKIIGETPSAVRDVARASGHQAFERSTERPDQQHRTPQAG